MLLSARLNGPPRSLVSNGMFRSLGRPFWRALLGARLPRIDARDPPRPWRSPHLSPWCVDALRYLLGCFIRSFFYYNFIYFFLFLMFFRFVFAKAMGSRKRKVVVLNWLHKGQLRVLTEFSHIGKVRFLKITLPVLLFIISVVVYWLFVFTCSVFCLAVGYMRSRI